MKTTQAQAELETDVIVRGIDPASLEDARTTFAFG